MIKVLVDCFVEVFVECLYEWVCKEFWGYDSDEMFSNQEIIFEKYCGICLVLGYFVCLDYIEKSLLWELLELEKNVGMMFIEYYVMFLVVVVFGWYFLYLEFKYFGIGKLGKDQMDDYVVCKGMLCKDIEKMVLYFFGYIDEN